MYEVFQRDTRLSTAENDMQKSFAFFEDLLIKHSVQSPPKRYLYAIILISLLYWYQIDILDIYLFISIKVFERIDVDCIMEFILERLVD